MRLLILTQVCRCQSPSPTPLPGPQADGLLHELRWKRPSDGDAWQMTRGATWDDKRALEQEVNKSAMAGQKAAGVIFPHVYYSRASCWSSARHWQWWTAPINTLSARQLARADTLNKTVITFHWLGHKTWPLNGGCHQMKFDTRL